MMAKAQSAIPAHLEVAEQPHMYTVFLVTESQTCGEGKNVMEHMSNNLLLSLVSSGRG